MIKRQVIKIDNLLTDNEMKLVESELLILNEKLEKLEKIYDNTTISSLHRVFLDDEYEFNRNDSYILNIITSKLFSESTMNRIGTIEPLLRLIPFSNEHETQYTVYEEGGEYIWHIDSIAPNNRIANFILYLNDNFEGGELELSYRTDLDSNLKCLHNPSVDSVIIPKKNTLVIIPSDMWHRVKPITKGKRKTINGHIGFRRKF